ncbi:MAG: NAD(+)/NADH kinase [Phycisphaeraceae bacterium]|nr:NAD(+)/NADH kinase [Phycisphaeraceae bacterium]
MIEEHAGKERASVPERAQTGGIDRHTTPRGAVVILSNASSGKGRAPDRLSAIADRIRDGGREVRFVRAGPGQDGAMLDCSLEGAAALVIAGGDGTVHHALEAAVASGVPIYHVPAGNENLFAREFGMDASPQRLGAALDAGAWRTSDLGECNGKLFALMVSVGFDAGVVRRVSLSRRAAGRNGGVSHRDYAVQGMREMLTHRPPRMSVTVDGRVMVEGERGLIVVANSRQYGGGLDPARDARTDDGVLSVVFLRARTRLTLLGWGAKLVWTRGWSRSTQRERNQRPIEGAIRTMGSRIEIRSTDGAAAQVDGEFLGSIGSRGLESINIAVRPGALRVLDAHGGSSPAGGVRA